MINEHKKLAISLAIKNKWQDPIYREKVIASLKGKVAWNKGLKTGLVPRTAFKKGYMPTLETILKRKITRAGYKHTQKTIEKIRQGNLGNISYIKGKTYAEVGRKVKTKGENHYRWISDRTQIKHQEDRNNPEYKQWRMKVWLRDNWKCKIANQDCGGRIEVHHILGFTAYPELRYEINNGITLCHAHHPRKRIDERKLAPIFQELVKG